MSLKGGHSQRISKDEAEQLERSDLTEEYGQPINSQNSCHSSESTENSRKRKRDPSLSSDNSLSSGSSNHGMWSFLLEACLCAFSSGCPLLVLVTV